MQGLLSAIAVLVFAMIISGFRRNSGVYSEPLSIAGLSTLLYKSPLLHILREIDSQASTSELGILLSGKRFALADFTTQDRIQCYGFVPVGLSWKSSPMNETDEKRSYQSLTTPKRDTFVASKGTLKPFSISLWHFAKERLLHIATLLYLSGLLTLIAYYYKNSVENSFEHFMDSANFGIRFLWSSLGVIVQLIWGYIDASTSLLPISLQYNRLTASFRSPKNGALPPPPSRILKTRRFHSCPCLDVALFGFLSIIP